jgi:hypothetical protein
MADICEICMNQLSFWKSRYVDYDKDIILCDSCQEEADIIYKDSRKSFEKCVGEVRTRKKN